MDDFTKELLLDKSVHDAKVKFLEGYDERKEYYEMLATIVKAELKLLENENPSVNAQYSHRVKTKQSLETKIEKYQKLGKCQTLESIQRQRWDIAAVRVCLYFPLQINQVRSFMRKHRLFEVQPVRLFREHEHNPKDQENRPYEERMGFYEADHYWICLRKDHDLVKEKLPEYNNEEIEIQVRTVLMDAWAEVRHDLDYKHLLGYPGEDELRVLDAIKGSISACEIMQNQLYMLREQRLREDAVPFGKDEERFWRAIMNSLRPRHKVILQRFETAEPSSGDFQFLYRLFRQFDIIVPFDLKDAIAELVTTQEQEPTTFILEDTINLTKEIFKAVGSIWLSRSEEDQWTPRHTVRERATIKTLLRQTYRDYSDSSYLPARTSRANLSSFLSMFLLSKMTVADIHKMVHGLDKDFNYESHSRIDGQLDQRDCVTRMYKNLCVLLDLLRSESCRNHFKNENLRIETLSTTWHVHEWISAHFAYEESIRLVPIITRLLGHYRQTKSADEDGTALWSLWSSSAVVYIQGFYENPHCVESAFSVNQVRHSHDAIPAEYLNQESWLKGELAAARIIDVELSALRHAVLYRALCENSCNLGHVQHCLEYYNLDVNWRTASAFATTKALRKVAIGSYLRAEAGFRDGLSLIHIAVHAGNSMMVERLISNPDLNLEAVWRPKSVEIVKSFYYNELAEGLGFEMDKWVEKGQVEKDETWTTVGAWTALKMAEKLVAEGARCEKESESKKADRKKCMELLLQRRDREALKRQARDALWSMAALADSVE